MKNDYPNIDYWEYIEKHCVRYYGWLPASKKFKKENQKKILKYFTLCAREGIDIFMLEKAKILFRDSDGYLIDVHICESDQSAAADIDRDVRPPLNAGLIVGELQKILNFEESEEVEMQLRKDDTDVDSIEIRDYVYYKSKNKELESLFPFDIINFDPYECLVNTIFEDNEMYKAYNKIFTLQKGINSFLLFLTTDFSEIHNDVEANFKRDISKNIYNYPKLEELLLKEYGTALYDEIEELKRRVFGFAKTFIISSAKDNGWNCEHHDIYVYEYYKKPKETRMLNSVVKFTKTDNNGENTKYISDLKKIILNTPKYFSSDKARQNEKVIKDLEELKIYSNQVRNEYRHK